VAVGTVIGFGLGLASTPLIVMVQSVVGWEQRGVATAAQQFCRNIGGTVWVSVQGAVLSAAAAGALAQAAPSLGPPGARPDVHAPARLGDLTVLLDPATRASLPPDIVRVLSTVLADSLQPVFWLFWLAAGIGLIAIALLPRGPLVTTEQPHAAEPRSNGPTARPGPIPGGPTRRTPPPRPGPAPPSGGPASREGAPP
jgi:hypothetical protein